MVFKFELSEQMVTIIGNALGNSPYQLVAPVVAELQKQIEAQQPKPNGGGDPMASQVMEFRKQ